MSEWRDIATAPELANILLFGASTGPECGVRYDSRVVFVGYWDHIDQAWCAVGSHWDGPFFAPTHWMPLPEPPATEAI